MSKKPDIWMPIYLGSYLADTARLTTEGHGAYLLILMDYWRNGPPPDDDEVLAQITRLNPLKWRAMRPRLEPFFRLTDGKWHQKRADEELLRAKKINGARSAAGKAGAEAKWSQNHNSQDGKSMPNNMANASQIDGPSPVPLQTSLPSQSPITASSAEADPWLIGKEFLSKRMAPSTVGAFLGKLCKDHGNLAVVEALNAAIVNEPADVKSYLVVILRGKTAKFDPVAYNARVLREGVA